LGFVFFLNPTPDTGPLIVVLTLCIYYGSENIWLYLVTLFCV
jgi:hypothetical protein